jgi:hypothetical protein
MPKAKQALTELKVNFCHACTPRAIRQKHKSRRCTFTARLLIALAAHSLRFSLGQTRELRIKWKFE